MKIPDINPARVEPLSSVNPEVYREQGKSLQALANTVGDAAMTAAMVMDEINFTKSYSQASMTLAALQARLINSPVLDPSEIPEGVAYRSSGAVTDEMGNIEESDRPAIFTHEVSDQIWLKQSQNLINEASKQIASPRYRLRFQNEMLERVVKPGLMAIQQKQYADIMEHGKFGTTMAINSAIQIGDEEGAKDALRRSVVAGTFPVAEAAAEWERIESSIDKNSFSSRVAAASNPSELEALRKELFDPGNRMDYSDKNEMNQMVSNRITEYNTNRTIQQEENAAAALGQIATYQLGTAGVVKGQKEGKWSWSQMNVLLNAVESRNARDRELAGKNPGQVSNERARVLRLLRSASGKHTMTSIANALITEYTYRASGLDMSGNKLPGGPDISGDDASELVNFVRDQQHKIFNDTKADAAKKRIREVTRADAIAGLALKGTAPTAEINAYSAFSQALHNYLDAGGTDPEAFVEANEAKYEPTVYQRGVIAALGNKYPILKQIKDNLPKGKEVDFNDVGNWLIGEIRANRISKEQAMDIMRDYRAQTVDTIPPETLKSLEPEDPIFEWIGSEKRR